MQFKDIINQESTRHNLAEMVQFNRLSHALLFLAKEGNGVLPLALAFAQFIVCDNVRRDSSAGSKSIEPSLFGGEPVEQKKSSANQESMFDSCGTCPSCLKSHQLIHPDIHFTYPV